MQDRRNENNEMIFDEEYDLEGLIRLLDSEEAAMELMYYDEDDNRHYRNRYERFECDRGISYILAKIERYLEEELENSVFVAFAAAYDGKLALYDGRAVKEEDVNLGELELAQGMVYGVLIRKVEEGYSFTEVVYHDGGETTSSWAMPVDEAGILTRELERLVLQFGE
ncbi:MAG: hypothetical protein J6F30_11715 [Cellulosilyticum sp.]|nr:hypothetical protein [Cellulosilyticum sp.]